jgi:sterol 3beta-glucosyltransferase
MASEGGSRERPGRKLTKRRRDSRRVSLDIPERFKDGTDADEDVTAPKQNKAMSMNQSIFSMIARAGQQSQTDLGTMVEDSGDSDDEVKPDTHLHSLDGAARLSRLSSVHDFHSSPEAAEDTDGSKGKHRRALSEHKLLRALPKLKGPGRKEGKTEAHAASQMSSSQFLPPQPSDEAPTRATDDPALKHKTKATTGEKIYIEKRRGSDRKSKHGDSTVIQKGKESVTLAKRLQEIFEFGAVEDVISGKLHMNK